MTWRRNKTNCVDKVLLRERIKKKKTTSGRIQNKQLEKSKKKKRQLNMHQGLVASAKKDDSGRKCFSCLF